MSKQIKMCIKLEDLLFKTEVSLSIKLLITAVWALLHKTRLQISQSQKLNKTATVSNSESPVFHKCVFEPK